MAREKRSAFAITKAVIFALVLREMQTRFGSRRMGAFWLMFEPIASIAVMMVIFTVIRARQVPGMDFPIFLLTGIVPFMLMRNIALKLMDSVEANRALFAYRNITIFDTYIARVMVECAIMSCVY
ncbi:sugar ABC transporter permease, partial [Alcaligenaceae bacterium 429]